MRIALDARVVTRDGEDAGTVQRAVVQPNTNEVTEFVVSTGGLLGHDVLVPRQELESAAADGNALRLRLSRRELEQLPPYLPSQYTVPPPGWALPNAASSLFPAGGFIFPANTGLPAPQAGYAANPATVGTSVEPGQAEPTLTKGSVILDRNGNDIGVLDDLRFAADGGQLDSLVVRLGTALQTFFGSGDRVDIPASLVERVAEQAISLRLTKEELKARLGRS